MVFDALNIASWPIIVAIAAISELAFARRGDRSAPTIGRLTDQLAQTLSVLALVGPPVLTLVLGISIDATFKWSGGLLALAGVLIRILAMISLSERYRLSPQAVLSKPGLTRTGPYGLVRHPGYAGLLFLFTGLALFAGGPLGTIFILPLLAGILIRIKVEEAILGKELGEAYSNYREDVRWKMIPGVL